MAEEGESVKVAVRVRPFNGRERRRDAKLIIRMDKASTTIVDPEDGNEKNFTFDFSYWSFNGSKKRDDGYYVADESHEHGAQFAGQKQVCDDMAVLVLKNAWDGYNATLFAYGQTGSGKSYSVVGYGINKGIVPYFCEEIFKGIDAKKASGDDASLKFEVTFSMLEIYAEKVRDLLTSGPKKSLRIRQHPQKGFYAQGMEKIPVTSYAEIEHYMEVGVGNRTVASTKMNATSSRAHTIVGITFVQKFNNAAGKEVEKKSTVNLVDLAGSERADSTGATGARLKEGAAINTSLSALGNVISALAEQSQGKNTKVPFRDSVLTKLLMNALGGNSKTLMVAAVSPADINYEESLSTLRYADRAKQIKTVAKVNEDPTEKLIRELMEENARLKGLLGGEVAIPVPKGSGETAIEADDETTEEELEALRQELKEEMAAEVEENEREMEEMQKTYEQKLKEAEEKASVVANMTRNRDSQTSRRRNEAHLWNLNVDPCLNGKIVHFLDKDKIVFGGKKANQDSLDVVLHGPNIMTPCHAVFSRVGDAFFVEAGHPQSRILINGIPIDAFGLTDLKDKDRVQLGHVHLFVMSNPLNPTKDALSADDISWEMAQDEISKQTELRVEKEAEKEDEEPKTKDERRLVTEMSELVPAIDEANAISEDLDKKVDFQLVFIPPQFQALGHERSKLTTKVGVRMRHLPSKLEWIFDKAEFFERLFVMREIFDGQSEDQEEEEEEENDVVALIASDPFWEDPESDSHVGSIAVQLECLTYLVDIKEQLDVIDYKGKRLAALKVDLRPEQTKGDELLVLNPIEDLVGKKVTFQLCLKTLTATSRRLKDVSLRYKTLEDAEVSVRRKSGEDGAEIVLDHVYNITIDIVTEDILKHLQETPLTIQMWAKQKSLNADETKPKTTKQMIDEEKRQDSTGISNLRLMAGALASDARKNTEAAQLAKRNDLLVDKINDLKRLAATAARGGSLCLPISIVEQILKAGSADASDRIFAESYDQDGIWLKDDVHKKGNDDPNLSTLPSTTTTLPPTTTTTTALPPTTTTTTTLPTNTATTLPTTTITTEIIRETETIKKNRSEEADGEWGDIDDEANEKRLKSASSSSSSSKSSTRGRCPICGRTDGSTSAHHNCSSICAVL